MKIAVLLPCYNEEGAIAKTVADFRANVDVRHKMLIRILAQQHPWIVFVHAAENQIRTVEFSENRIVQH